MPASFRKGRNSFGEGVRLYGDLGGLMRNSGMLKCKITLCAACFFAFFYFYGRTGNTVKSVLFKSNCKGNIVAGVAYVQKTTQKQNKSKM